jgi:two-component system, NarL family, invasion response regulator UvrY
MIRVFLADDHALLREGLKRVLSAEEDITVVGEAGDGEEVMRRAQSETWDLLVLDLSLPGRSGFDVLKHLKAQGHPGRILVLSMQAEDQYALRVLAAGADGYLSKGRPIDEVVGAIRKVALEGKYLTARLAELVLACDGNISRPAHYALTDRELDVMVMLGKGKPPSLVAAELGVSASTVSTHARRIKEKLGLTSLGEVVQYAVRAGLA